MKHSRITIIITLFSMIAFLFTREHSASMGGSISTNMSSDVKLDDKYIGVASYVLESKSNELKPNEMAVLVKYTEGVFHGLKLKDFENALSKHDCFKLKNPNKVIGNNLREVPSFMDTPDWFTIDCSQKNTSDIKKAQKKMKKKLKKLKKKFKNN